jgi:hypothetical protein
MVYIILFIIHVTFCELDRINSCTRYSFSAPKSFYDVVTFTLHVRKMSGPVSAKRCDVPFSY